jgi:hypothetical protein
MDESRKEPGEEDWLPFQERAYRDGAEFGSRWRFVDGVGHGVREGRDGVQEDLFVVCKAEATNPPVFHLRVRYDGQRALNCQPLGEFVRG